MEVGTWDAASNILINLEDIRARLFHPNFDGDDGARHAHRQRHSNLLPLPGLFSEAGAVGPAGGAPRAAGGHLGAAPALRGIPPRQGEAAPGDPRQERPGRFSQHLASSPLAT